MGIQRSHTTIPNRVESLSENSILSTLSITFLPKASSEKNGLLNPVDYCSLGIHPTLSTKTYYTVKTYVWKKKNSNEKKNNDCSKELPQYQKFDNLYKVFLFLFFCSQWHFYSLLVFILFSFLFLVFCSIHSSYPPS